jgi:hypothetical protein
MQGEPLVGSSRAVPRQVRNLRQAVSDRSNGHVQPLGCLGRDLPCVEVLLQSAEQNFRAAWPVKQSLSSHQMAGQSESIE